MIFGALRYIARELRDRAEDELYSEDSVHAEMTEAYSLLESGTLGEEEFARREEELMTRLQTIQARRRARNGEDSDDEDSDDEDSDGEDSDGEDSDGEDSDDEDSDDEDSDDEDSDDEDSDDEDSDDEDEHSEADGANDIAASGGKP